MGPLCGTEAENDDMQLTVNSQELSGIADRISNLKQHGRSQSQHKDLYSPLYTYH
jgi:hypothetical protein